MLLVPPLVTGTTWSASNFLRFPQSKHRWLYLLQRAFHSSPVKEPPLPCPFASLLCILALDLSGLFFLQLVSLAFTLSGFLCSHSLVLALHFSGFFFCHFALSALIL